MNSSTRTITSTSEMDHRSRSMSTFSAMPPTLRALLEHVIDYAGLFLPAKLPIDESVRNYLTYEASPRSWMVGGFVCPARRLEELAAILATYERRSCVFECCVIARPAEGFAQAVETV